MKTSVRILTTVLILLVASACSKKLVVAPSSILNPPRVSVEEPNGQLDPLASEQWSIKKLELEQVWQTYQSAKNIKLALIGTGVDYNHEDLNANIFRNRAEIPDGVDNDGNGYIDDINGWDVVNQNGMPYDKTGTGTAMAGVIGAIHKNGKGIRGICSSISIVPVKYVQSDGQSNVLRLVEALKYAEAINADVVLLHYALVQFSGTIDFEKASLQKVLANLKAKDIPIIISAGNMGASLQQNRQPVLDVIAQFSNVLIVTSVDSNDRRPFIANYGMALVGTAAPGENVLSTLPNNRYGFESGTALAAAQVAGAVSLALANYSGRINSTKIIRTLVTTGGDSLPEMQFETTGGNRLNISKFMTTVIQ